MGLKFTALGYDVDEILGALWGTEFGQDTGGRVTGVLDTGSNGNTDRGDTTGLALARVAGSLYVFTIAGA